MQVIDFERTSLETSVTIVRSSEHVLQDGTRLLYVALKTKIQMKSNLLRVET